MKNDFLKSEFLNDLKVASKDKDLMQHFAKEYVDSHLIGGEIYLQSKPYGVSVWSEYGQMTVPDFVRMQYGFDNIETAQKALLDNFGLEFETFDTWIPSVTELSPEYIKLYSSKEFKAFPEFYYRKKHLDKYGHRYDQNRKNAEIEEEKRKKTETLFTIENEIFKKSKGPITQKPVLISYNGKPLIRKNTLNMIQGQTGVHKSRLATSLIKTLIYVEDKKYKNQLGLKSETKEMVNCIIVDTERNHNDELPLVVKDIYKSTGIIAVDKPYQFLKVSSLKLASRKDRLWLLKSYVEKLHNMAFHIFLVLDVVTDCMYDFNNVNESLELSDYLNKLCEEKNCTILAIVHENPTLGGMGKARGHIGTELMNKSSTILGISRYNDEVFKLQFKKLRNSSSNDSILIKYDDKIDDLVKLTPTELKKLKDIEVKAPTDKVVKLLQKVFNAQKEIKQNDLVSQLENELECSSKTSIRRIDKIIEEQTVILTNEDGKFMLFAERSSGKPTIYKLVKN